MKAARLRGIRDVEIDEIPVPEPGPGEARVRVTRVGMCGSDVHYYAHMRIGYAVCEPGHISGHEAAGVVDKLGPDIEDDRLEVGARVAVEPHVNCGACERCITGHPNQCPHARFISSPPCVHRVHLPPGAASLPRARGSHREAHRRGPGDARATRRRHPRRPPREGGAGGHGRGLRLRADRAVYNSVRARGEHRASSRPTSSTTAWSSRGSSAPTKQETPLPAASPSG